MLPSKNRLKLSFFKNNKIWQGQRLTSGEIQLVVNPNKNTFRVATIVSKKVAPKAVDRNRIKRLVAQAMGENQSLQAEVIVIVKKNIATLKKDQVKAKLTKLLQKLK